MFNLTNYRIAFNDFYAELPTAGEAMSAVQSKCADVAEAITSSEAYATAADYGSAAYDSVTTTYAAASEKLGEYGNAAADALMEEVDKRLEAEEKANQVAVVIIPHYSGPIMDVVVEGAESEQKPAIATSASTVAAPEKPEKKKELEETSLDATAAAPEECEAPKERKKLGKAAPKTAVAAPKAPPLDAGDIAAQIVEGDVDGEVREYAKRKHPYHNGIEQKISQFAREKGFDEAQLAQLKSIRGEIVSAVIAQFQ